MDAQEMILKIPGIFQIQILIIPRDKENSDHY